jgi:hypothetical protein
MATGKIDFPVANTRPYLEAVPDRAGVAGVARTSLFRPGMP